MLVLSRKVGEAIRINSDIVVVVTAIEWGKIKLGIEAPREVPIFREEAVKREAPKP